MLMLQTTEETGWIETFFGMDGPFPAIKPDYAPREQQIAVSCLVNDTITEGGVCVAEAATGVGKSLAYLIPAIKRALETGERTVISTHTIALQAQLFQKDIPLALKALGVQDEIKVVLMKGRSNFLCRMELDKCRESFLTDLDRDFQRVLAWSEDIFCDGDKDNLGFVYERWNEVSATHDSCTGKKCPYYKNCFYYQAKDEAKQAQIIVANHALVMVDLTFREKQHFNGGILPKYQHIIFDEAHHLEAVATEILGIEMAQTRIQNLVNKCRKTKYVEIDTDTLNSLEIENIQLFGRFDNIEQQEKTFENHLWGDAWIDTKVVAQECVRLCDRIANNLPADMDDPKGEHEKTLIQRTCERISSELYALFSDDLMDEKVRWAIHEEARGRRKERIVLKMQYLHAGRLLAPMLWEPLKEIEGSATLISATLATNGGFDYLRGRLSLPYNTREMIVGSPFNYKANALLYVPGELPEPPKQLVEAYSEKMFNCIRSILDLTEGRAFILFTSWNAMREMHKRIIELPYPIFMQGERPLKDLIADFKSSGNGVLLGTASFWEGVDIPGEALSCVIIDKIPFTVPTSPLEAARMRRIDQEQGRGASFMQYSIPQAQIKLKQGFGRLIRTQTDRGIVCILDTRLLTKGYGAQFVSSLPPASRASRWGRVEKFWKPEIPTA